MAWEHGKRRAALAGCFQRAGFPEGEPGPPGQEPAGGEGNWQRACWCCSDADHQVAVMTPPKRQPPPGSPGPAPTAPPRPCPPELEPAS